MGDYFFTYDVCRARGPDFLTSKEAKKAYADKGIVLWQIPARSPDLNPIEKIWRWLRR